MNFPQELLDEILSYLPPESLPRWARDCSLVARSWLQPSRRRLFESVSIRGDDLQSWLDTISPTNVRILQHVRSFHFSGARGFSGPMIGVEDLYTYFPSFRRLQAITLRCTHVSLDIHKRIEMFSPSKDTLLSLTLSNVSLSWPSFITLVDYFPNLRDLQLEGLSLKDGNPCPSPLSRPLHGKLSFLSHKKESLVALCDWFCESEAKYDELAVHIGYGWASYSQNIVHAYGKNLKRLGFHSCECNCIQITS